jgi:hypothetical protein
VGVKRTGDWDRARRLITGMPERLERATDLALRQEAQLLRSQVVQGLTRQAPAGRPLEPLADNTLAARRLRGFGGTKALIRRGDLRNAITAIVREGRAWVGVPRKARGPDGASLADVAELNEFGSGPIVIPITPRMRRFLFALRKAGGTSGTSSGSGVPGVIVARIPARPFLRPVFEQFRRDGTKRFLLRVARLLNL